MEKRKYEVILTIISLLVIGPNTYGQDTLARNYSTQPDWRQFHVDGVKWWYYNRNSIEYEDTCNCFYMEIKDNDTKYAVSLYKYKQYAFLWYQNNVYFSFPYKKDAVVQTVPFEIIDIKKGSPMDYLYENFDFHFK